MELVSNTTRTKSTKRPISDRNFAVGRRRDKQSISETYHPENAHDDTGDAKSTFEAAKTEYARSFSHMKHGRVTFFLENVLSGTFVVHL